jgi:hypothetical protein
VVSVAFVVILRVRGDPYFRRPDLSGGAQQLVERIDFDAI